MGRSPFYHILFFILLFIVGGSAYAGCTVNGEAESGAISLADLQTAIATGTDDVTTCNVSEITDMSQLFKDATSFNQDISEWEVGNVTDMWRMFMNATSFNQDIGDWNVSSVTHMQKVFKQATAFNQDISEWNVSEVKNMLEMFEDATSFNQDLSSWDVRNVKNMGDMFVRTSLSTANYDALLISWSELALKENVDFHAIGYATLDQAGQPLRKHSVKNNKQHSAFLEAYPLVEERQVIIDWFKTLPFYIETESIRVVHANWNDRAIQILDKYLDNNQRLKDHAYDRASAKESELYHAVETVLKGPEVRLPDGVSFSDNDGIVRTQARVNWWVPQDSFLEEKLQLGSELKNAQNLKTMALDDGVNYDSKAKLLFVGHYWLKDEIPKPLSGNSVCVDYSIAKSGKLVAYQWQGEEVLNESQFVW